jgi:hypothetical protein
LLRLRITQLHVNHYYLATRLSTSPRAVGLTQRPKGLLVQSLAARPWGTKPAAGRGSLRSHGLSPGCMDAASLSNFHEYPSGISARSSATYLAGPCMVPHSMRRPTTLDRRGAGVAEDETDEATETSAAIRVTTMTKPREPIACTAVSPMANARGTVEENLRVVNIRTASVTTDAAPSSAAADVRMNGDNVAPAPDLAARLQKENYAIRQFGGMASHYRCHGATRAVGPDDSTPAMCARCALFGHAPPDSGDACGAVPATPVGTLAPHPVHFSFEANTSAKDLRPTWSKPNPRHSESSPCT